MKPKHSTDLQQVSGLLKTVLAQQSGYDVVADFGAGTGTKSTELARLNGKALLRYDPALPEATNKDFWDCLGGADVLTCANVLNVITDDKELYDTIDRLYAAASLTKNRTALITVYKAHKPSKTQRAEGMDDYRAHLITRAPSGTIITIRGKIITVKLE